MSGDYRTLSDDTRFDRNSVCGVGKSYSGQTRCTREIQRSRSSLALVWVRGILGRKVASEGVSGDDRTLSEDTKLVVNSVCGVGKGHSGQESQPVGSSQTLGVSESESLRVSESQSL